MTDKVLLPAAFRGPAPADDVAVIPGWGVVPGAEARAHIAAILDHAETDAAGDKTTAGGITEGAGAFVWLRRLFTDPTGRDLVALDSTRRRFQGGLRKFLQLRDPTCRVPWCDAPAIEADHVRAVQHGGATTGANAGGLCKRHNLVKEEVGWSFTVRSTGLNGTGPHGIRILTPTGCILDSTAPPILGEGWLCAMPDPDPPFMELDEEQERFAEEFGAWLEHAQEGHCWAA